MERTPHREQPVDGKAETDPVRQLVVAVRKHEMAVIGWKEATTHELEVLKALHTSGRWTRSVLLWVSGMVSGLVLAIILAVILGPVARVVTVTQPAAPAPAGAQPTPAPQKPVKGK